MGNVYVEVCSAASRRSPMVGLVQCRKGLVPEGETGRGGKGTKESTSGPVPCCSMHKREAADSVSLTA